MTTYHDYYDHSLYCIGLLSYNYLWTAIIQLSLYKFKFSEYNMWNNWSIYKNKEEYDSSKRKRKNIHHDPLMKLISPELIITAPYYDVKRLRSNEEKLTPGHWKKGDEVTTTPVSSRQICVLSYNYALRLCHYTYHCNIFHVSLGVSCYIL